MHFSLGFFAILAQSGAVRPELSRASVSTGIASIGNLISRIEGNQDALPSLRSALDIVGSILAEEGNATEHMSSDDEALLRSVITLVDETIYASMDQSHTADVNTLDAQVGTVAQCNTDIANRQSDTGDLGETLQRLTDQQTDLNEKKAAVDEKTEANNTAWEDLENHMQILSDAPACPAFPSPSMTAMDSYFESSDYATWYAAQQSAYADVKGTWSGADEALTQAISAYNIELAVRDTMYCDYELELEVACASFDSCFADSSHQFDAVLVPRVTADAANRVECFKAGETLIHQIKFLLGDVDSQETPAISTGRFEITVPTLPAKGLCDMSPLTDAAWVPEPSCVKPHKLVDGCSNPSENKYSQFFSPNGVWERSEISTEVAGEAVCCNDNGKATRHYDDQMQPFFPAQLTHEQCTTTTREKLVDGVGTPSHTFDSAKALCKTLGLRLCKNVAEVDTACGTGCHINAALVWIEDV